MTDDFDKKLPADKIALALILIAMVLAAQLLTAVRTAVIVSKPLKLQSTGLSVAMPKGRGWKQQIGWKFTRNRFSVNSTYRISPRQASAVAICSYLIAAYPRDFQSRLEQLNKQFEGKIKEKGQLQNADLTFEWALLQSSTTAIDVLYAICELENGRLLEIEIRQALTDTRLAKKAFSAIVQNIRYQPEDFLANGKKLLGEVRNKGLAEFASGPKQQSYFIIKAPDKANIGFSMRVYEQTDADSNSIQGAGLFYLRNIKERAVFLRISNRLDEYIYKSETSDFKGQFATELRLNPGGTLSVIDYTGSLKEETFTPGVSAIPDLCLDLVLAEIIRSQYNQLVIDVISADGTIRPFLFNKIEPEQIKTEPQCEYAIEVKPVSKPEADIMLFDKNMSHYKTIVEKESIGFFEKASAEKIKNLFPERSDFIFEKRKMLKHQQI